MACGVAVKRSLDSTFMGLDGVADEPTVKHYRTTTHCSPFRASFGTMANSLPSSSFAGATQAAAASSSPFAAIHTNLNPGQLESYLMAEVKHLRRRRLIPRRRQQTDEYRPPGSPPHSSDSEGENHQSCLGQPTTVVTPATSSRKLTKAELFEKPQFSLNQVQLICERLLKEQEARLRAEYETVLNNKLQDQYETFCKFTEDQIKQKMDKADEYPSYLS